MLTDKQEKIDAAFGRIVDMIPITNELTKLMKTIHWTEDQLKAPDRSLQMALEEKNKETPLRRPPAWGKIAKELE